MWVAKRFHAEHVQVAERADWESGGVCGEETGGEEAESFQQRRGEGGGSGQEEPPEEEEEEGWKNVEERAMRVQKRCS